MKTISKLLFLAGALSAVLLSCSKSTTENYTSASINDYSPLVVGKYIIYQVDSTVFTNFQSVVTIRKYQVKNEVDAQVTDAQGRPAFRVHQYIRDSAGTQPWVDNATFLVTPLQYSLEVVENNLRFIKLQLPIRNTFSWKGNSYITDQIGGSLFFYNNWDYTYQDVDKSFTVPGTNKTVDNTITVFQRDEILPDQNQAFNTSLSYYEKTYSNEVWGKGIGLIYREFIHWDWQRPNQAQPGKYEGYGIKMKFLDKNF